MGSLVGEYNRDAQTSGSIAVAQLLLGLSIQAMEDRVSQILSPLYAENNRHQQTKDAETRHLVEQAVAFDKQQLKALEKRIVEIVPQCEAMSAKSQILQSYPRVGPATTAMLLAELPELGQLNRAEI